MSNEEPAHYTFLPWFRRGLSAHIDTTSSLEGQRASFPITLYVNETPISPTVDQSPQTIKLGGPGDFDKSIDQWIIRTDPKNDVGDFEPNNFPAIEFPDPDFPWRFTPTKTQNNEMRLKPWICLIVLKAEGEDGAECESGTYGPDQPLRSVKVKKNGGGVLPLPDLDYCWAWAHIQVTGDLLPINADNSDPSVLSDAQASLEEILRTEPERAISRLICPRRLEPGVLYHAFVVPTFKAGLLAGLGHPIAEDDSQLLEHAWNVDDPELELPYYYKWEFRTGERGDFEYLVRLLEPREIDRRVGKRDISCSKPGYSIPAVERLDLDPDDPLRHALELEGALMTVDSKPTPWPGEGGNDFQEKLKELLNFPEKNLREAPDEPPIITPPIYGRWHAAQKEIKADNPRWLNKLNQDPRYRTIAGFGTLVVQDQQEKLMASAWKQVGAIEEANELLRQAQFAREASERIQRRHLFKLSRDSFLRVAAPLHSRVLIEREKPYGNVEKVTVMHHVHNSPIPRAALDPAFRRIFRKRGPIRRRQRPDSDPKRKDILDRLNSGDVAAAGEHPTPDGAPGVGDVSELFRPSWARGWLWRILKHLQKVLLILVLAVFLFLWLLNSSAMGLPLTHPLVLAAEVLLALMAFITRRFITPGLIADEVQEENLTPQAVESSPARPDFQITPPGSDPSSGGTGGTDSTQAAAFRDFAMKVQEFLNYSPPEKPQPKPIDLNVVRTTLLDALDPKKTIVARTAQRLRLEGRLEDLQRRGDPLKPIMAAPEFPQPMYEPLRDISQELLLPGLRYVPQNTLGLLETNLRFINSYMLGLNHEFARELLWREYPTDQRGSYFRQFWDVSGFMPAQKMLEDLESDIRAKLRDKLEQLTDEEKQEVVEEHLKEKLRDIKPIHRWGDVALRNNNREDPGLKESLVLLIRGDLLKKYPSAVIYAARGKWDLYKGRYVRRPILDQSDDNTKTPMFSGTLPPDVTFFGFYLTADEARGPEEKEDDDAGWFIVIEERISEARLGMDEYVDSEIPDLETWEKLSWGHFIDNLSSTGYIDGASPPSDQIVGPVTRKGNRVIEPPGVTWGSHSANIAWITMQKPMRVAVHATDMLPEKQSSG